MRTNDSSSGREQKISLALCLPSNRRAWRDVSSLGTRQNTTSELLTKSCEDAPLLALGRNGILVRGGTDSPNLPDSFLTVKPQALECPLFLALQTPAFCRP